MKLAIDLWQWAQASRSMVWEFQAAEFSRFSSSCLSVDDPVVAEFSAVLVDPDTVRVSGSVKAKVRLQCQNCLQPVEMNIDESYSYDGKRRLDSPEKEYFEVSASGELNILELIEDELLLSLPTFPRHETSCNHMVSELKKQSDEARNPFSVLNKLKIH